MASTVALLAQLADRLGDPNRVVNDLFVDCGDLFLGDSVALERAIERIRIALRPGGWVLTPTLNPAAGEAVRAVWSLIMESWGGPVLDAPEAEAMLKRAGLQPRSLPGPSFTTLVVAQRPD